MKKPFYDQNERQIMKDNNSLYAATMQLRIAKHSFCKALAKTPLFKYSIEWIYKTIKK